MSKKTLLYLCGASVLVFVNYLVFSKTLKYFFLIDEWQFLWAGKYARDTFTQHALLGGQWLIKTGVLHYLYVYLYTCIFGCEFYQVFGFVVRCINTLTFYFLAVEFTKSKKTAFLGSMLFAISAAGFQAYTWHRTTGIVMFFIMLGTMYYHKYLHTQKLSQLIYSIVFLCLALAGYIGRAVGVIPLLIIWTVIHFTITKPSKLTKNYLIGVGLGTVVLVTGFIVFSPDYVKTFGSYIYDAYKNNYIYWGSIGSLLQIPFRYKSELFGLSYPDTVTISLGIGVFFINIIMFCIIALKKSKKLVNYVVFVTWIYVFYVFNWFYGGGGTGTAVGSTHRYLSISAIGPVMIYTLFLGEIKNQTVKLLIFGFVALLTWQYSNAMVNHESEYRNEKIIKPIYLQIANATNDTNRPNLIVLHTPNILKSIVPMGSMEYALALYEDISTVDRFPTVIPDWEIATKWICATREEKMALEASFGIKNYGNLYEPKEENLYGWFLQEDGQLIDKTAELKSIYHNCPR